MHRTHRAADLVVLLPVLRLQDVQRALEQADALLRGGDAVRGPVLFQSRAGGKSARWSCASKCLPVDFNAQLLQNLVKRTIYPAVDRGILETET